MFENVGVRKKGFVGSVLKGSDTRPSLKIKADKFEPGQLIGDVAGICTIRRVELHCVSQLRSSRRVSISLFLTHGFGRPHRSAVLASVKRTVHFWNVFAGTMLYNKFAEKHTATRTLQITPCSRPRHHP